MIEVISAKSQILFRSMISCVYCGLVALRTVFYHCIVKLQPYWQPHNRAVARRIQNMGWRADGGLWLLVRGGGLYLSKGTGVSTATRLLTFYFFFSENLLFFSYPTTL